MDTKAKKIIKNVAVLDLRTATEESVAGIERVENAAIVVYSQETAHLVTQLNIGNVAISVKVPADAQFLNGQEWLSRDSFSQLEEPMDLFVNGQLILESDIPEEDVRNGLNSLVVNGQIIYPDSLAGVIKSKMAECNGQAMAYPAGAKLIMGKLTLTESQLRGLADDSSFFVMGQLIATDVLPNELIEQKLKKVEVQGRVTCREENVETLLARVQSEGRTTIIPTDYAYLPRQLVLDAGLLDSLPGPLLYASSMRLESDITPEALDAAIDSLVVTDLLIAPGALRSTLAKKCNLLETKAIFYADELWLIDGETPLNASRFDFLEGKATLVVHGELAIEADVDPKLLAQNFDKVHNFGEIYCTPAQMSALQARLGTNSGEFILPTGGDDEGENVIGNAAHLAL